MTTLDLDHAYLASSSRLYASGGSGGRGGSAAGISNVGDDRDGCFGGSGSTSIASLNLNRYSISLELEQEWFEVIKMRLENYEQVPIKINGSKSSLMKATKQPSIKHQVSLFG